jgi:hypothetical protein
MSGLGAIAISTAPILGGALLAGACPHRTKARIASPRRFIEDASSSSSSTHCATTTCAPCTAQRTWREHLVHGRRGSCSS